MENAQPEPSMEEILASIRRIISEDEEGSPPGKAAPAPSQQHQAASERAKAPPMELIKDRAKSEENARRPDAPPVSVEERLEMTKDNEAALEEADMEEIIDRTTAAAASAAFRTLSQNVRISEGPGRTLEDIVIEMLQPMIKDWLDANLPAIVEEKVEDEVQRVARRRR
jgi:hypothetical protein